MLKVYFLLEIQAAKSLLFYLIERSNSSQLKL